LPGGRHRARPPYDSEVFQGAGESISL